MVSYPLKGEMQYVRGATAGRVLRRAAVISNACENSGKSVEAVSVYHTGDPDEPWVATILVQES